MARDHFNFSQERLGVIHCNFADMFSILLLNDSQSVNKFEISFKIFSRFYCVRICGRKQALIGETSNENQIRQA